MKLSGKKTVWLSYTFLGRQEKSALKHALEKRLASEKNGHFFVSFRTFFMKSWSCAKDQRPFNHWFARKVRITSSIIPPRLHDMTNSFENAI
jgi:hypothetical protein